MEKEERDGRLVWGGAHPALVSSGEDHPSGRCLLTVNRSNVKGRFLASAAAAASAASTSP